MTIAKKNSLWVAFAILLFLFITLKTGASQELSRAALEETAKQFFQNIIDGKEANAFQGFAMSDTMRSWIQTNKPKDVGQSLRRQYGEAGELQKTEIIQHDPQTRSVELFYSGKTKSFKIRVSFKENQIVGFHHFPWTDERSHGGTPIQLETPTGTLYGTLLTPEADKPVPIVLFLAGSGQTDRNYNQPTLHTDAFRMLAESLQQSGIASVRFDKRGVGASAETGADESKLRFEHYVEDAVRWIDFLSQENKYSKIIVLGHSEGSLVGMLACLQSEKVNGFISLCGAGRPIDEVLREQTSSAPKSVQDAFFPILDTWKQGKTVEKVPTELLSLARPSVQPYMISWMKYDPRSEIKKLTIPTLIVQGATDIQVSVADADKLSEANPKAKKVVIKDMNHVLKTCTATTALAQQSAYTNPKTPLHKDLVPCLTQFIAGIE